MQTNIICFGKGKLMFTDGVLPILMELKHLFPQISVEFLVFNRKDLNCLKMNHSIWDALDAISCTPKIIWGSNRIVARLRYILFVLRHLFQKNIFILHVASLPYHRAASFFLKTFSKLILIRHYHHVTSSEGLKNDAVHLKIDCERKGKHWKFDAFQGEYDYWMSPLSNDQYELIFSVRPPYKKMVYTGYVKRLSQWQKFIVEKARESEIMNDSPYFLYALSYLGKGRLNEIERVVLLKETLQVLQKYSNNLRTIFKPHPTTDVNQLTLLLQKIGYKNYVIDYTHPVILSVKAKFVIGNAFSTVMNDAYFHGVPIIEYSHRDEELVEVIGGTSTGGKCVDFFIHRDEKKLQEVLCFLRAKHYHVVRDGQFIDTNFPRIPQDFYVFWQKLILGQSQESNATVN